MGEWTKGPLRNDGDDEVAHGVPCIVLAAGEDCGPTHRRVAEVCHQWDGDELVLDAEARANAARIIACWNAMLGIPDPAATMKEVRALLARIAVWAEHFPKDAKYGNRPTRGPIYQAASSGLPDAEFTVEDAHEARRLLAKLGGE